MKRILLFLLMLASQTPELLAQDDARELVRAVYRKIRTVQAYTADVEITADIPMLRIPPVMAKVSFKQPDQLKFDSKSLAVLPRQGFTDFAAIISDTADFNAISSGDEVLNGQKCRLISILPGNGQGDLILGKLWIDAERKLILQSQMTYRSSGTVVAEYTYGKQQQYGLPDLLKFSMDVRNMTIPKAMTADMHLRKEKSEEKDPDRTAKIEVRFTNYRVNP
jgi:outer membrane lipoprotein-sorting protein